MNDDQLQDDEIKKKTDPELDHGNINDLPESVGDVLKGRRTEDMLETDIGNHPGDMGATGDIGLEEIATKERLAEEAEDEREWRRQPSDLISPGDPNAGDVGISGGMAVGDVDTIELEGDDFEGEEVV